MRDISDLYYECHVTIDPVFGESRETLSNLIKPYKFKLAKLVMMKNGETLKDSTLDTFFTAHSKHYSDIQQRMVDCVREVKKHGYVVRRAKIEDTILDTRNEDILGLLD